VLYERLPLGVETALHDLPVDHVTHIRPALTVIEQPPTLGQADGAIEGNPAHHLAAHEVLPTVTVSQMPSSG
jgi:hypothetical protein